jgi:ATP-dependent Clp protease ATP-binding subunit ClpA
MIDEKLRKTLSLARTFALQLGQPKIDVEHLFQAILFRDRDSIALQVIVGLGATHVEFTQPRAHFFVIPLSFDQELPMNQTVRKILFYAEKERSNATDCYLQPHHIILGILGTRNKIATALAKQGITLENVRPAVLELIKNEQQEAI